MPSKIKVLQVIPKLGYGGAETGCYDIAHYLHEKDFGSYVVTSGGDLLKYVNNFIHKLSNLRNIFLIKNINFRSAAIFNFSCI